MRIRDSRGTRNKRGRESTQVIKWWSEYEGILEDILIKKEL